MTTLILESEATDRFNEFLNEVHETVKIGDLHYDPARVLAEVDPIAWRMGFNDWLDSEDLEIGSWEEVEEQENLSDHDFTPEIIRKDIVSGSGARQWHVKVDGQYYIVSAVHVPYSGPETYVFEANEEGEVTEWNEVVGMRGVVSHDEAISELVEQLKCSS